MRHGTGSAFTNGTNLKRAVLVCLLSVAASAQVVVTRVVKDDPATGLQFVTILLAIKGDKPYSDDPSAAPAEFGIMCQETNLGKQKKLDVSLTLGTGIVPKTGFQVADPVLFQDLGIIATLVRLDDEPRPRQLEWQQTADPGILTRNDFKFVHDHLLKSKTIHIEVGGSGAAAKVSSFDLLGLREAYGKHPECKR
jgi:hypothetical protein